MPTPTTADVQIPNRSLFRHNEVCDIAQVQPYVLRSWEAEFSNLGVSKTEGGPRVYRRADVERVLRIKHLLFVEGLTLAGARRRIAEERGETETEGPPLDDLLKSDVRERIVQVRQTLRELAALLARTPGHARAGEFHLEPPHTKHAAPRRAEPRRETEARAARPAPKRTAKPARRKSASSR